MEGKSISVASKVPGASKPTARIVAAAGIAVLLVALFFGFGLPVITRSLAAPQIGLTNERTRVDRGACDSFLFPSPPEYLIHSFTLYNSGDADGLATVQFFIDGVAVLGVSGRYFVAAHGNVDGTLTAALYDCAGLHSFGVHIVSITKA